MDLPAFHSAMSLKLLWNTWWRKPTLRDDGSDVSRKASWLELFYDLVFVVIIAELSHKLAHDVSWEGIGAFVVFFVPAIFMWLGSTIYNDRFDNDDASHRTLTFLKMLPAAGLALSVHMGIVEGAMGFAFSYAAARVLLAFLWARAGYHNEPARQMGYRLAMGSMLSASAWILSAFVDPPLRYALWGLGVVIDVSTPFLTFKVQDRLPNVSTSHILERYDLFTIIVLGESVVGVVSGVAVNDHPTMQTWIVALLGMMIAFGFWWSYFDNSTSESPRLTGLWSILRAYMHLPMIIGLAATGAAVLELVSHQESVLPNPVMWLLAGGVALALGAMGVIEKAASQTAEDARVRRRIAVLRWVSAVVAIVVAVVQVTDPMYLAGWMAVIVFVQPLFSALFKERELVVSR